MSTRPKRNRRAPERYEPDEIPIDDYDDDEYPTGEESSTGTTYVKKWKGQFDDLDDDDDDDDEPDEYDENDGFLVPDDQVSEEDEPFENDDEEEEEFDDEEEEFDDEDEPHYEDSYESDVIDQDGVVEYDLKHLRSEEGFYDED